RNYNENDIIDKSITVDCYINK
ncbi:unnamed protein product, partial [Rotaria sordida]